MGFVSLSLFLAEIGACPLHTSLCWCLLSAVSAAWWCVWKTVPVTRVCLLLHVGPEPLGAASVASSRESGAAVESATGADTVRGGLGWDVEPVSPGFVWGVQSDGPLPARTFSSASCFLLKINAKFHSCM